VEYKPGSELPVEKLSLDKSEIKDKLAKHEPFCLDNSSLKPAAVLLPLFKKDDRWHVLLTRRSPHLPTHRNEISFPGGVLDEGEKKLEAALRETHEEVGIKPEDVDVLDRLDEVGTMTNFCITPFVGVIPYPYTFTVSEDEIAEIIEIALDSFTEPENYRRDDTWLFRGKTYPVYYFNIDGNVVWGATAKILKQFIEIVLDWREP